MRALEITAPLTMYALYIGIDLRHAETLRRVMGRGLLLGSTQSTGF
jgi:hypothetical protein